MPVSTSKGPWTLTAFGETKLVPEWAKDDRCQVHIQTLYSRVRSGWDGERALTAPLCRPGRRMAYRLAPKPSDRELETDRFKAALHALVDILPSDRKWTAEKRDLWIRALTAVMDYFMEVVPEGFNPEVAP